MSDLFPFKIILLLSMCLLLYFSFVCISAYANVYFKTTITKHENNTNCGSVFEPGAPGLPYYFTSTCVRSCCTWRASCVDSKQNKKNGDLLVPSGHARALVTTSQHDCQDLFTYTPAAPHHHNVLYSYTIVGRAAAQLYFRRNFGWFSLGQGHSSCLGFVLLKFLFAYFVKEKCGFQDF